MTATLTDIEGLASGEIVREAARAAAIHSSAGCPEIGPPPVVSARQRRMDRYEVLIGQGMTRAEAAAELGITDGVAWGYEKALGIAVAA